MIETILILLGLAAAAGALFVLALDKILDWFGGGR